MELQERRYPIGIQTFSEIREKNYIYIDKTEYVYRMANGVAKYLFLSRPRRFGKSLLTSTLHSYFAGRRDLFGGLAIERLEKDWAEYPVLHFDMSTAKHVDRQALLGELSRKLSVYERVYGRADDDVEVNQRLQGLIEHAHAQTGRQVVVLIDEYDAPLLDVMHEEDNLPVLRNVMRNFYSPLKACDPHLRFVFLTGITKFSQLSIFSELNNIKNITMLPEYAAVCGISSDELATQMGADVELLAGRLGVTPLEAAARLRDRYDGYHFAMPSPDIYNPFSLMNAFADGRLNSYWFGSGTPTYLIEMLRKYGVAPQQIGSRTCQAEDFDAPTERMADITPLLYQSGYITIKDYDADAELYTLDIPNTEVRVGLMRSLLGNYVDVPREANTAIALMSVPLRKGDMDGALRIIQQYLGTIPYCSGCTTEGHYQQLLYVIFSLLGHFVDIEVRTPRGRVDMVIRTKLAVYVVELKIGSTAVAAMAQIDLRQYPERFALAGLPVVKVAVSFDTEARTISDWKIEGE